jgi:Beta-propeller repeat
MNQLRMHFVIAAIGLSALISPATYAASLDWARQIGTSESDGAGGVAVDAEGNVYVTGSTYGSLGGPITGVENAFVTKFDPQGNLLWARQLGDDTTQGRAIAADQLGNVYISGWTNVNLAGPPSPLDDPDALLAKYDSAGNLLWTGQFTKSSEEYSNGVSADRLGNVFITGYTFGDLDGPNAGERDAFVTKYDANGNRIWTKQLGTDGSDYGYSVSADGLGNVYLSGSTEGDLGGPNSGGTDAFLSKFDGSGNLLWSRQLGPAEGFAIASDGVGGVFVGGTTSGDLNGQNRGSIDAYVAKYDALGNQTWIRQLGTTKQDWGYGLAADGSGGVVIVGETSGNLAGTDGGYDAFCAKYDSLGQLLWAEQFGTTMVDAAGAVASDGMGSFYVVGSTRGSLGGDFAGGSYDGFLVKLDDTQVPEPTTLLLTAWFVALTALRRRMPV